MLLFASFSLLLVQILWLLLAQQLMQNASLQITRYMAAGGTSSFELGALQHRHLRIIPGYIAQPLKKKRLQPTDATIQQFGIFDARTERFRLPADFVALRAQQLDSEEQREKALLAQVLQQEITYCMPLHVPIAATLISQLYQNIGDLDAYRYCAGLMYISAPRIPIRTKATAPLEHDLWL